MLYRKGADAVALLASVERLDGCADDVEGVRGEVGSAVHRIGAQWAGADARAFVTAWNSTAEPELKRLHTSLAALSRAVERNAKAQQQASAAMPGGPGGPRLPGAPPLPPRQPTSPPGQPTPPADERYGEKMRGQEGRPDDKELWKLAFRSYGPHPMEGVEQPPVPPGYTQVSPEEAGLDPALFDDPASGLHAELYRTPEGGYVLAFRGSNENNDWDDNFGQGLGLHSKQYEQAMSLGKLVSDQHPGNVVFTGHSLGGGLAAAAGLATGATAVTFDAAGVHANTAAEAAAIRDDGSTGASVLAAADQGQMRTYHTSTDILTGVSERSAIGGIVPDAPGSPITVPTAASAEQSAWESKGASVAVKASLALGLPLGPIGLLGAPAPTALANAAFNLVMPSESVAAVRSVPPIPILQAAQMGVEIGKGAYGHHWHPMDAAMEKLYPG